MWRKKWTLALGALLVMLLLTYTFRIALLTGVFQLLIVTDHLEPADLIFVMNGDPTVRPGMASRLYQRGLAPRVVIARAEDSVSVLAGAYPNVTDSNLTMLRSLGIPDSAVVQLRTPGGATSTADEAMALHRYCREHAIRKVILVTSEMHSRRARFIFTKFLSPDGVDVRMAPVADRKYGARNWWKLEDGVIGCQNEYMKLLFYHLKY